MLTRAIIILLCSSFLAIGQGEDALLKSYGLQNGRYWETLGKPDGKLDYVIGMMNGIGLAYVQLLANKQEVSGRLIATSLMTGSFTAGDIVNKINRLYSDRENIIIPIAFMFRHTMQVFKGKLSAKEQEELLQVLRQSSQDK